MAFQMESAVRDYYFTTQRPSTIAAAAIMNAIDQVNDHDYEYLTITLLPILKEFDFDLSPYLLKARDRLHRLVNDHEQSVVTMLETKAEIPSPRSYYDVCSDDDSCATVYS